MTMMKTKNFLNVGSGCLLMLAAQAAHAAPEGVDDGVVFVPIPDGGTLFKVEARGFEVSLDEEDDQVVDRFVELSSKPYWRYSCFAVTPWLPSPGDSRLSIYPKLRMDWTGEKDLRDNHDVGLMNFVLESRGFDAGESTKQFYGVDTGMMDLIPLFFPDRNTCVYLGQIETSMDDDFPLVYRANVQGGSEFRGLFCGLMDSTRLELSGIDFELLPTEH